MYANLALEKTAIKSVPSQKKEQHCGKMTSSRHFSPAVFLCSRVQCLWRCWLDVGVAECMNVECVAV